MSDTLNHILEKDVALQGWWDDAKRIIDDKIINPVKDKVALKPETLSSNTHFNAIVNSMTQYVESTFDRAEAITDLDAYKKEVQKIIKLDLSSLSIGNLKEKFDLLGLSDTGGLIKSLVTEFPQLIVSCPTLILAPANPVQFKKTITTIFDNDKFKSRLNSVINSKSTILKSPIHHTDNAGNHVVLTADVKTLMIIQLVIELVAAYIVFIVSLIIDVIKVAGAAAATAGAATPLVLLAIAKNVVGFAAIISAAIIAFIIELKLNDAVTP